MALQAPEPLRAVPVSGPALHAIIIAFTLVSAFSVNPYSFGSGDNRITIPFLKASLDAHLYPGGFLIAERHYYYTYLWNFLGILHARLGVGIPTLFFGTYLIAVYFTFLGLYRIAGALFGSGESAVLAMVFLLFSRVTLAGVLTVESQLNTRAAATPLLLFAIHSFLGRSTTRAFLLLGIAYLIHPLTTHYVLAMLLVATWLQTQRFKPLAAGIGVFLLVASPLLLWSLHASPRSLLLFSAAPAWLGALRLRSWGHSFPFTWGSSALVHAIAVILLFAFTSRRKASPGSEAHAAIRAAAWTIVGMCTAGVVFSECIPLGIALVAQPLRSFVFLEYFMMVYVAGYCYPRIARSEHPGGVLGVMGVGIASFVGADQLLLGVLLFITIAAIAMVYGRRERRPLAGIGFATLTVCMVCVAAGAHYAHDTLRVNGEAFSFRSDQDPEWLDVQRWARSETGVTDAFIVPPGGEDGFRVDGERAVYVEWEDGGLMNSDPAFGIEWLRRMRALGFVDSLPRHAHFRVLSAEEVRVIAKEMRFPRRRVFVVWSAHQTGLALPVRYRNADFMVYEVTPTAR